MALLTLNGVSGSDVCYWDISDLQSPFNTEHYIRAGITSIPIPFDSEWADIESFVLDYTMAPTSNTQDNTNGSVALDTAQTVYGFAQSSYGLCYQAGEAEEWPGMWPELDVTLTLTPTSKSIAALVQGLSYAHAYTRKFIWYMDGIQKLEQAVAPPITQHEYVIAPVYFASTHKVKVQIYNATKTVLFFEDEKTTSTLYPTITPWSWAVSNGEATDAETAASFASLVSEGLVENFHWKVWNDFVNKVNEARTETGQAWKTTYATKAQALVAGIYSDLTVASFNSIVQNLDYPFWNWAQLPGSPGYLGRLLMRGTATMGENADDVYYQYILELARKLNIVIGIYNNTADIAEAFALFSLTHYNNGSAHLRQSRPVQTVSEVALYSYGHMHYRPRNLINSAAVFNLAFLASGEASHIRNFIVHTFNFLNYFARYDAKQAQGLAADLPAFLSMNGMVVSQPKVITGALQDNHLSVEGILTHYITIGLGITSFLEAVAAACINKLVSCHLNVEVQLAISTLAGAAKVITQPISAVMPHVLTLSGAVAALLLVYLNSNNVCGLFHTAQGASTNQLRLLQVLGETSLNSFVSFSSAVPVPVYGETHVNTEASALIQLLTNSSFLVSANNYVLSLGALLEAQGAVTWDAPIQTDTDLFIRQVYYSSRVINTLNLE